MEVRNMARKKDLRSFKPGRNRKMDQKELIEQAKKMGANDEQTRTALNLNEEIKKYEGKSEDAMMGDLLRMAKEQKQSGELNSNKIAEFRKNVWPMLNNDQKRKMQSMLDMLEKQ